MVWKKGYLAQIKGGIISEGISGPYAQLVSGTRLIIPNNSSVGVINYVIRDKIKGAN